MNTSGEVADLMVKEGIEITEAAAKLAGLGAKNLAAIIIALVNDDNKTQGMTKRRYIAIIYLSIYTHLLKFVIKAEYNLNTLSFIDNNFINQFFDKSPCQFIVFDNIISGIG